MTWEQLKQTLEENRKEAEAEAQEQVVECPDCAWPILSENSNRELLCPICGWRGGR